MKRKALAILAGSLFALPALADVETGLEPGELHPGVTYAAASQGGKSRDVIRDELVRAQRAGDTVADAELGLKANQASPWQYPEHRTGAGKTRDEVRAELVAAQHDGEIVVNAELGLKANQLEPWRFGAPSMAADGTMGRRSSL